MSATVHNVLPVCRNEEGVTLAMLEFDGMQRSRGESLEVQQFEGRVGEVLEQLRKASDEGRFSDEDLLVISGEFTPVERFALYRMMAVKFGSQISFVSRELGFSAVFVDDGELALLRFAKDEMNVHRMRQVALEIDDGLGAIAVALPQPRGISNDLGGPEFEVVVSNSVAYQKGDLYQIAA